MRIPDITSHAMVVIRNGHRRTERFPTANMASHEFDYVAAFPTPGTTVLLLRHGIVVNRVRHYGIKPCSALVEYRFAA